MLWLEGIVCNRHDSPVLDGVTLGVSGGELIVIQGSTASGKSTLLEIAATVRPPDRGAVWFAGRNTATLQKASLPYVRRNIGYYSASSILVEEDTACANVLAALAVRGEPLDVAERCALDALTLVGAQEVADRRVDALSSGQQRLIALARALAGPPPLVIADEPGALLSDEARTIVVAALAAVRDQGAAVLTATADTGWAAALVAAGGRRIHLADGKIAGAPAVELVPPLSVDDIQQPLTSIEEDGTEVTILPPASKGPR